MNTPIRSCLRFPLICLQSLLFLITVPATGQDAAQIESNLNKLFVGKIVTLKHHFETGLLKINAAGAIEGNPEPGTWTLTSKMQTRRIKIKNGKLIISGERLYVRIDADGQHLLHTTRDVDIEVQLPRVTPEDVNAALKSVLLGTDESLADYVPAYWVNYFRPSSPAVSKPAGPLETVAVQKTSTDGKPIRVLSGVLQGKIISQARPAYPGLAKANRIAGQVVFRVIIGKDGTLSDLQIVRAAGMGLDEAAYNAVKQWRYRPYVLNGDPVEVESEITVNFAIGS
jgi:TonB family protein